MSVDVKHYLENDELGFFHEFVLEETTLIERSGSIGKGVEPSEKTFDTSEEGMEAVQAKVISLMSMGFEQRTPPEERMLPVPAVTTYWNDDFVNELQSIGATPTDDRNLRATIQEHRVFPFAPNLQKFLEIVDTHALGFANFGEWRIWDGDFWAPHPDNGNLFEQLVLLDQENYLGTAMFESLTGGVFVGTAGNGDAYFAYTNYSEPSRAEVYFWDHETADLSFIFADDISTLAFINHWYREVHGGEFDLDALKSAVESVSERLNVSWHYDDVCEEAEIWPEFESDRYPQYAFHRSKWISYLLRQNGVINVEDAAEMFYPDFHTPLLFSDALKFPHIKRNPITQLYWLWRLWFFDHKDDLATCIEIVKESPSPVAKDAALLIESFESGRKELGKIEDIHQIKAEWLALDIDPARAEARLLEEAEQQEKADADLALKLEVAHERVAAGADLQLAAWEFIDEPAVLAVFQEHLIHTNDQWDAIAGRLDFLDDDREDQTAITLSLTAHEWAPFLLNAGVTLDHLGWSRNQNVIDYALTQTSSRDEYNHKITRILNALSRSWRFSEKCDAPDEIVAMLDEFNFDQEDFTERLRNKDALRATISALGSTGDRRAADALLAFLPNCPSSLVPRVFRELGFLKSEVATGVLVEALQTEHYRPALFALACIASSDSKDQVLAFADTFHGDPACVCYERTARHLLLVSLEEEKVDLDFLHRGLKVLESEKNQYEELRWMQLFLIEKLGDDTLYENLLDSASLAITMEAARRLGDVDLFDPFERKHGQNTVESMLENRRCVFKTSVVAGVADAKSSSALIDYLPELCRFTDYTMPYVSFEVPHIVAAMDRLGELADPAIDRHLAFLLSHPNPIFSKWCQYDDEAKSRLDEVELTESDEKALRILYGLPPEGVGHASFVELGARPWFAGGAMQLGRGGVNGLQVATSGEVVVAASARLSIFSATGERLREPDVAVGWIYDIDIAPDQKTFATGAHGGHCDIWDFESCRRVKKLTQQRGGIRKVKYSPDGSMLAAVSDSQTLVVYDTADWSVVAQHHDKSDVNTVAWQPDASHVVIGTDRAVHLIAVPSGEIITSEQTGPVAEIQIFGEEIFVGANEIRVFDLNLKPVPDSNLSQESVSRIRITKETFLAASWEGEKMGVWRWDRETKTATELNGHSDSPVFALDVDNEGRIFAGGGLNSVVRWEKDGSLIENGSLFHGNEISGIASTDSGLVTCDDGGVVIVWRDDLPTQQFDVGFRAQAIELSEGFDSAFLSGFGAVAAWEISTKKEMWNSPVERSEFLFKYRDTLMVASDRQIVWVDAKDGSRLGETEPFSTSFLFHAARIDERHVVCAGYEDRTLFLFDLEAKTCIREIELLPGDRIRFLAASKERIAISRWDRTVSVFTPAGELRSIIREKNTTHPLVVNEDTCLAFVGNRLVKYDSEWNASAIGDAVAFESLLIERSKNRLIAGSSTGSICAFEIESNKT